MKSLRKLDVANGGTSVEPAEDVQIHLESVKSSAATWLMNKVSRAHKRKASISGCQEKPQAGFKRCLTVS
jgi:hypothetical protein